MYLNRKIRFFNMIEILLALGVIAIGMTSILGLFPVGLNASRQAVAENSSANVAEQMSTYLQVINESVKRNALGVIIPPTNYDNNIKTTGTTPYLTSKYASLDIDTKSTAFLTAYKAGNIILGSAATDTNFPRVANKWAIFKSTQNGMFFIVQGPNCTEDSGSRPVDYAAMALVWKSTVQIKHLKAHGVASNPGDWLDFPLAPSYTKFGQLNIELSWPLELPYAERKYRYYQVVINNPSL